MYYVDMTDSDLITHLMKTADPAKAELVLENARLRAENERLIRQLLRMRQEKAQQEEQKESWR